MKNLLLLSILFFVCTALYAQHESLEPLLYQVRGEGKQQSLKTGTNPTINGQFFYNLDTLELPFFDDFCTNKFQPYTATPSDPNVTTVFYYSMLDASDVPMPLGTVFSELPTYKIEIDTIDDTQDTTWFVSTTIKYNSLASYPVDVYGTYEVYPPYIIIETLGTSIDPDTIWIEANLLMQDTAEVYIADVSNPEAVWIDYQAYHNYTRGVEPWSLGVVTFDGLDENGFPYAINTTFTDYADHLTSKVINLNYPAVDSIYFSFLFQAGGFGDMPEEEDSLILQFFNVNTQLWENAWGTAGVPMSDFKLVHIPINQSRYLQNGFKFRFRNYGGLSGDLDNWHIDYVNLRRLSGYQDTLVKDFAFVYPVSTLLKDYTSIPWKHFRNNPSNLMSDNFELVVRNGSNLPENNQPGDLKVYYEGNLEHTYTFPGQALSAGDLNYAPRTVYYSYHDLGTDYEFPTSMSNDTTVVFDFEIAASAPFAQLTNSNDTTRGQQVFANYYAYDDGSAEAAYGVTGLQARLAYQFHSLEPDSLVAVQMCFVPSVYDHRDKIFLLTVWGDNGGKPGAVLYQDDFFFPSSPVYMEGKDLFWHYYFRDNVKIPISGTFYVGWRQIEGDRLNIGFDRNTNAQSRVFYSTDGELNWFNSSFEGAMLMRPVVSSKLDYLLNVDDFEMEETTPLVVYPNPFTNTIHFSFVNPGEVEVYALDGRKVVTSAWDEVIETTSLSTGIYVLVVKNIKGELVETFKITKQ